jgi:hypothetical protein
MWRRIILVGIFSAIGSCACVAQAREWCDATGKYKIEATFVGFKDGMVELKKENGATIYVPLSKLREEDQKFVMVQVMLHAKEAEAEARKAEPAAPSATSKAQPAKSSTAVEEQPTTSTAASKEQPATRGAASKGAMFEVVKTEIVEKPVEVNGCRVTPKNGCVLYVCTVTFTKAGMALSHEALGKLKIARASKQLSKTSTQGNVISKGDFCLRLDDDTTVACYCLPAADASSGLPVKPRARGGENWLMYCGNVRFLASMKPEAKPESLVWGGTYEAKIAPPTKAAAQEPAKTAVAQAPATPPPSPKAAAAPAPAPAAKAPPAASAADAAAAARAAEAAIREQRARRTANLNKGALREVLGKHPELESMNIGPQLISIDELWDDKDQFKPAAFESYIKRMYGAK